MGDGEEVYYGSNLLAADDYTGVVGNGNDVGLGELVGPDGTIDIAPAPCRGVGYPCDYDTECCGPNVLCCWDGAPLRTNGRQCFRWDVSLLSWSGSWHHHLQR
ncbi:MAG: hypothetical protein U0075_19030 [Thermomicrobiales bacterium]